MAQLEKEGIETGQWKDTLSSDLLETAANSCGLAETRSTGRIRHVDWEVPGWMWEASAMLASLWATPSQAATPSAILGQDSFFPVEIDGHLQGPRQQPHHKLCSSRANLEASIASVVSFQIRVAHQQDSKAAHFCEGLAALADS